MKSKNKGFTLVELLVVIAILAVLASVSIVAYIGFTKKANLSNDQTMVKMINDNLAGESVSGQPANASEALDKLYAQGFSDEKLVAFSKGHHYVYSLSNNKFYLVNEKDEVIYPEANVDKSTLWGLYRDEKTDKIAGVTNYVAMRAVTSQDNFNSVFDDTTSYKLDLNNNYAGIAGKNNVSVSNGSVQPGSTFITDTTVAKLEECKPNTTLGPVTENVYFTVDAKPTLPTAPNSTITIKNSTFDGKKTQTSFNYSQLNPNITEIIIENCTFINNDKWSFTLGDLSQKSNVKYIIRNNKFVNSTRGINIVGLVAEGSVIEGNEFRLSNDNKANAIQISHLTNLIEQTYSSYTTQALTIKNNNVHAANAFVVAHSSLVCAKETERITAASLDKFVLFENNQIVGNISRVVPDPDATKDLKDVVNGVATLQTYVDKLLTLVK